MSAGTVKIKGVSGVHRSKRSMMRVYAHRKMSNSNQLEHRAHNLMNSEPGRQMNQPIDYRRHKEVSPQSVSKDYSIDQVPIDDTKRYPIGTCK